MTKAEMAEMNDESIAQAHAREMREEEVAEWREQFRRYNSMATKAERNAEVGESGHVRGGGRVVRGLKWLRENALFACRFCDHADRAHPADELRIGVVNSEPLGVPCEVLFCVDCWYALAPPVEWDDMKPFDPFQGLREEEDAA